MSLVRNNALLLATDDEVTELKEAGFAPTILMESDDELTLYRRALYGPSLKPDPVYHTYDQITARAEELMRQRPDLMVRFQIGETTQFHRPIYA